MATILPEWSCPFRSKRVRETGARISLAGSIKPMYYTHRSPPCCPRVRADLSQLDHAAVHPDCFVEPSKFRETPKR